jgi:RNA polymerase sigma factor (sigma-70 family)
VRFMDLVPLSDEVLMRHYAAGDAKSFELLYQRHESRVWRYLERSVRNRAIADELMQEVWFSVARQAEHYRPSARFTTWLFTITHNRMVDSVRSSRAQVSLEELAAAGGAVPAQLIDDPRREPHASAIACEQAQALMRAIEVLSQEQREAFLLHMEGELTVDEIAAVTECSFETAKSRLRYARRSLRQQLKEYL